MAVKEYIVKIKLQQIYHCDFGGSVPKYVTNQISVEISMTVEKLHNYLRKYNGETRYNEELPGVLIHGPKKWYEMQHENDNKVNHEFEEEEYDEKDEHKEEDQTVKNGSKWDDI